MTFTVAATVRRTLVELLEVHRGVQLNPEESPNIFRVSTCDILGTFVSRTHLRTCIGHVKKSSDLANFWCRQEITEALAAPIAVRDNCEDHSPGQHVFQPPGPGQVLLYRNHWEAE